MTSLRRNKQDSQTSLHLPKKCYTLPKKLHQTSHPPEKKKNKSWTTTTTTTPLILQTTSSVLEKKKRRDFSPLNLVPLRHRSIQKRMSTVCSMGAHAFSRTPLEQQLSAINTDISCVVSNLPTEVRSFVKYVDISYVYVFSHYIRLQEKQKHLYINLNCTTIRV